ncbi:glycosyltransferase family 4 protein [Pedobacter heparinus]|uniref:Glycosyl transferase group 1 n=1 Tax=Pedobacter heparinus (strain ATCC 13125 / DSM 2366 / CIP 104194 / JCM 7457 / NBRC 12017 / NCIMB 9290 / NRRL B-14731 / HIM 762-3) TaxID=485917 RepID=C6XVL8_PEDHD|nr:glycosyltransferase family 4 protein [Pedobacter heparinus]ACU06093.1 glycosyl transferase group 1 [Pedobacter heparinus DSM 2366]
MKIAILVNPLIPVPPEQYGGIERIVYLLIKELQRNGHEVILYAHKNSQAGCKLIAYQESVNYGAKDFIKINALTAKIAFQDFDVLHTFGRMNNIALMMWSKIPKVVSYQLPPTISQVKKATKIAFKNTLYFTACSNFIARQINKFANVTTIYNGVNINEYQFNATVSADAPLVFLGRIQEEKGTSIAIQVARTTGRKLIIAGNIPAEETHKQYFSTKVKPFIDDVQISYIGPVNNFQKNELLGNSYALLMPVTWDEPFGIVMAEALACGTPVIGFNRGAIPEVVINGLNGFVCNTLTEMIAAVGHIPEVSRLTCRGTAEDRFNAVVLGKQYENLYRKAINRR